MPLDGIVSFYLAWLATSFIIVFVMLTLVGVLSPGNGIFAVIAAIIAGAILRNVCIYAMLHISKKRIEEVNQEN